MNICMYGFSGQNMNIWLSYFKEHPEHHITFFTPSFVTEDLSMGTGVRIIEIDKYRNSPRFVKSFYHRYIRLKTRIILKTNQYDLFILHGLYNWEFAPFLFNRINAEKKIVLLWNDINHRKIIESSNSDSTRRIVRVLEQADYILPTWETTRSAFLASFPHLSDKTITRPWGIQKKVSNQSSSNPDSTTSRFLSSLNKRSILLFWPRTLRRGIRHDILLDALELVPDEIPLISFLAMGKAGNSPWDTKILTILESLKETTHVVAHRSEHIPLQDILPLYNRADLMVNLADSDQLSSCVMEAVLLGVRVILSDIPPYRELLRLGFQVTLTDNSPQSVASAIMQVIPTLGSEDSERILENNRDLALSLYNIDKNLTAILNQSQKTHRGG